MAPLCTPRRHVAVAALCGLRASQGDQAYVSQGAETVHSL